jgi:hypothetical protein
MGTLSRKERNMLKNIYLMKSNNYSLGRGKTTHTRWFDPASQYFENFIIDMCTREFNRMVTIKQGKDEVCLERNYPYKVKRIIIEIE